MTSKWNLCDFLNDLLSDFVCCRQTEDSRQRWQFGVSIGGVEECFDRAERTKSILSQQHRRLAQLESVKCDRRWQCGECRYNRFDGRASGEAQKCSERSKWNFKSFGSRWDGNSSQRDNSWRPLRTGKNQRAQPASYDFGTKSRQSHRATNPRPMQKLSLSKWRNLLQHVRHFPLRVSAELGRADMRCRREWMRKIHWNWSWMSERRDLFQCNGILSVSWFFF